MSHFPNNYMIIKLWKEGNSLRETGRRLRISKDTVRRALNRQGFDTSQGYFGTVIRENDTSQPRFDTSRNMSQGKGKGRGGVGGKLIFLTLALILIVYLIYMLYCHFEKKKRDRQASENPKEKKTFGFGGRSVEDLEESTGFEIPGEDLPEDPI